MPEIAFYHLCHWPLERALPKLLEKALERGYRAIVLTSSRERVEDLNTVLWTYDERSWLPHGSAGDGAPATQPIYLTVEEENPNSADLLVVVDGRAPKHTKEFTRIVDMFDGHNEDAVAAARKRWQAYKDQGFNLTYWQQTEVGGWDQRL